MAKDDIPVFRAAQRGQVVRSDDWNAIQRELRNSVRGHRHTRKADDPSDDAAEIDVATQIATDEIADGAVTGAKIATDTIDTANLTPSLRAALGGGGDDAAKLASGVSKVSSVRPVKIEHGLGKVPVAVVVAVSQDRPFGLEGVFDVYGFNSGVNVAAATPAEPDGTFFLVVAGTDQRLSINVRWVAFALPESRPPVRLSGRAQRAAAAKEQKQ